MDTVLNMYRMKSFLFLFNTWDPAPPVCRIYSTDGVAVMQLAQVLSFYATTLPKWNH
jgi:hypothetical protein